MGTERWESGLVNDSWSQNLGLFASSFMIFPPMSATWPPESPHGSQEATSRECWTVLYCGKSLPCVSTVALYIVDLPQGGVGGKAECIYQLCLFLPCLPHPRTTHVVSPQFGLGNAWVGGTTQAARPVTTAESLQRQRQWRQQGEGAGFEVQGWENQGYFGFGLR